VRFVELYMSSSASNYAAGLAFHAFVSTFPLILAMIALVGLLPQAEEFRKLVESSLAGIYPKGERAAIALTFSHAKGAAGALVVVSVLGFLWTGTNLFSSMEFALNEIHLCVSRSILRSRLMGLAMIGTFVAAIALTVGANALAEFFPGTHIFGFLTGWLVMFGLLIVIYRYVPNRPIDFAEVWPGALLAALSIEVLTIVFPIYADLTNSAGSYGRQFGFLFVLATWFYFLCMLLLMGAVLNRMRVEHYAALRSVPKL
jgi:membrane protein